MSGGGILEELGLGEADLREDVARPSSSSAAARNATVRRRWVARWARDLRGFGHSPDEVARIIGGGAWDAADVRAGLRLAEVDEARSDESAGTAASALDEFFDGPEIGALLEELRP